MRGTIRERRPGVWQVRAYVAAEQRQLSVTVKGSKKEAERELRALVERAESGIGVSRMTLNQFAPRWMNHLSTIGRSVVTLREYERLWKSTILPVLGKVPLTKLTAKHLDDLYAAHPGSVSTAHAMIRSALSQAVKWDLVSSNVALKATPPKTTVRQIQVPSAAQVNQLIRSVVRTDPTMALILSLAVITGARRGELCALRWRDYDRAGTLTIQGALVVGVNGELVRQGTKTGTSRTVHLGEKAISLLDRARSKASTLNPDAPILTYTGEPIDPNWLSTAVRRHATRAGLDCHLHLLRHVSATELIAQGIDIRTVADRLGHADATVTLKVYSHARPENDQVAAKIMDRRIGS